MSVTFTTVLQQGEGSNAVGIIVPQVEMARLLKSSQSRVAKIEAGDASVSLDLIVRALLAVGATRKEVQTTFASKMLAAA